MAPTFWANYFERVAIVGIVLLAVYFLARKLRETRLFLRAGRRLNVVESTMLSPHAALHLVRVDRRHFLIGSGSAGVTKIGEIKERPDRDAVLGDAGRRLQR